MTSSSIRVAPMRGCILALPSRLPPPGPLQMDNAAGRKTSETNANGEILRFTNNAAGDLLSLTDGKNQTTTWHYDQFGRVTNKLDQVGTEILRYQYDAGDRLTNRWSAAKGNTGYAFDPVGNLTNINYPNSPEVTFAYDALSRLTRMVDASGTNTYSYTAGGKLLTDDGPFASDMVTNTYSNRERTALALQQPAGLWTNGFTYDPARRLSTVASPAGAFSCNYAALDSSFAGSLVQKLALPSGAYITNYYDSVARVLGTVLKNSSGTTLDTTTYGYNLASQRTSLTNFGGVYVQYGYDNIGQLRVADSSINTEDFGYTYDRAWNLNYRTNSGALSTFVVDNKNELTNAFAAAYSYDANGNLVSGTNGHTAYVYDDENRLIQWFLFAEDADHYTNGALRSDFIYDGMGRLRIRIESYIPAPNPTNPPPEEAILRELLEGQSPEAPWLVSSETHYIYDGKRVIQERDGNNTPLVSYTRGNDLSGSLEGAGGIGGLLARSAGYSGGNWTSHACYRADGNDNITCLIDAGQLAVARYRYDPFGNTVYKYGALADANVYRFSSKELHVASGTYYYLYRFYDSGLQRWLNRDPLGELGFEISSRAVGFALDEDSNCYRFAANEPVGKKDDWGLSLIGDLFDRWGYGNSCGWSRRGQNGPPIDEVDAACAQHDRCLNPPYVLCKIKPCDDPFCGAVGAVDCSKSPNPSACRRAKRDILLACTLAGSGLPATIGIIIGIFR